jgi:transketolase
VRPFSATFLVFSDYMKPAIRLGALSKLRALYVFTHDSIGVGEDGPTHEPVEQLAGLRAIPGLTVIRPADATETVDAWRFAIEHDGPTLFALTRQNLPHLDRSRAAKDGAVARGAYILSEADGGSPEIILIGTGSEVALCAKSQARLRELGVRARVVSMPSWNLFEIQDDAYRESVLPGALKKRVTVEAGCSLGWHRWAAEGTVIAIDHFGASAPGEEIMKNFGFTAEHVTSAALRLMGRNEEADKEYGGETAFSPTAAAEGHS